MDPFYPDGVRDRPLIDVGGDAGLECIRARRARLVADQLDALVPYREMIMKKTGARGHRLEP